MKKDQKLKAFSKIKFELLLGGALAAVVILLIVFLMIKTFQNNSQSETPNDSENTSLFNFDRDYLTYSDPKIVFFGQKKITLPTQWSIQSFYRNPNNANLQCVSIKASLDCIIYEVSNGTSLFYFSTPVSYRKPNFSAKVESANITFLGEESLLITELFEVINRDDSQEVLTTSDQKSVQQAYVCNSNNICLSSGILSYDLSENAAQYQSFKELLKQISLEEVI